MSHMTEETGVKCMVGRMNAGYEIIGQWPATEDGGKVVVLGHKKEGYTPYVLWTVFPSADTNPGGAHENMEEFHWGHYHMDFESAMEGLSGKLGLAAFKLKEAK